MLLAKYRKSLFIFSSVNKACRVPPPRMPPVTSARHASLPRSASLEALASAHRPAAAYAGVALRFRPGLSLSLPSEMWGAASLAVQLSKTTGAGLTRVASAWQPFSTAAAPSQPQPSGDEPKSIAAALDFQPALTPAQDTLCLLASAGVCAAVYCATAPAAFQLRYAAGMALLYGLLVVAGRAWLLERQYKALQRSERELASPDSQFLDVEGIEVHYKCRRGRPPGAPPYAAPAAPTGAPLAAVAAPGAGTGAGGQAPMAVHCLHGFGASAYSWSFVQGELARALGAVVTAHDMPGFGLTQRPSSPRYYTLGFNGSAARAVMDAELSRAGGGGQGGGAGRPRRVLVGHSMGGAAVAEGLINDPEGVEAIVLVAPAIVALWAGPPKGAQGDAVAEGLAVVEEVVSAQDAPAELELDSEGSRSDSEASISDAPSETPSEPQGSQCSGDREGDGSAAAGVAAAAEAAAGAGAGGAAQAGSHSRRKHRSHARQRGPRLLRVLAAVAQAAALQVVRAVVRLAGPLLVLPLRRLVRSRRFWERGLASAWVDKSRVGREYVDAYRSGQLVRGWERGILNFLAGRFAEKLSFWDTLHHVLRGDGHLSQAERLARVVEQHGIRVLIVHGTNDVLVPAANSRRLAALLPRARLVEFGCCGHMPQEEEPERFVEEVVAFLNGGWGQGGQG